MSKRIFFIIPILILLGLFFLFSKGLKQDPRLLPSTLIHQPAPAFSLNDLVTQKIYTQEIFLHHVTLLNVWASWCETCQEEQSDLMQIHQKYPKLQMIGINEKDSPKAARTWLQQHGNPYQIILEDPKGLTAIDYGIYGTPETFLIGPDGVILGKQVGVINQQSFIDLMRSVKLFDAALI